jgi:ketosteroid isomerase-like protein
MPICPNRLITSPVEQLREGGNMRKVTVILVVTGILSSLVFAGCAKSAEQSALEQRVATLEDIQAITALRAEYCYYCDTGDWQKEAALYTDDAVCDFGPFGYYDGKEAITEFFRDLIPAGMDMTLHMVHNPKIEVTGDTATGEWYYEVPYTTVDNQAGWIAGKYFEDYVKVNGEWKFKKVVADWYWNTPYEKGWAEEGMIKDPSPGN